MFYTKELQIDHLVTGSHIGRDSKVVCCIFTPILRWNTNSIIARSIMIFHQRMLEYGTTDVLHQYDISMNIGQIL